MRRPGRMFAYTLALALGCANVDAMLRSMTAEQFAEWEAYYLLNPFGHVAENSRTGIVASVVANASGNYKKAFKPSDFMPRTEEEKERDLSVKGAASLADALRAAGVPRRRR